MRCPQLQKRTTQNAILVDPWRADDHSGGKRTIACHAGIELDKRIGRTLMQIGYFIMVLTAMLGLPARCRPARCFSIPFRHPTDVEHSVRHRSYQRRRNSFNLTLDLVQPTNIGVPVPATSPGIVLIHGGSFTTGDKTDLDSLAATYATYGYNVVSINYRLIGQNPPSSSPGPADNLVPPPPPFVSLTQSAEESTKSTRPFKMRRPADRCWMRDNAASVLTIDPNRIGIGGVSAGAIDSLFGSL